MCYFLCLTQTNTLNLSMSEYLGSWLVSHDSEGTQCLSICGNDYALMNNLTVLMSGSQNE